MSKNRRILVLSIGLCFGLAGLYASCVEPFFLKVTEWEIVSPKWEGQENLRIALVADVHAVRPWMTPKHIERIVERTNDLGADLVLLLGDYVATHPFGRQVPPEDGVAPYKKLSAPCGVFAVLGNHDLHGEGSDGWPEALKETGLPVLENTAMRVECEGRTFWIAGLEDLWHQNADVQKTMAQVTDDRPVILMMHNPDSFVEVPSSVVLSVAGHTHGGQVQIPFIGPVEEVIPSRFGNRFAYGHIQEDGKDMVVSGGIGMTGLPIRFLTPPEIVLVNLSASVSKE